MVVSISDAKVSKTPDDVIITYSLGSCIGVALWDAARQIGGLLHFQLPTMTLDAERAKSKPFMFADSGLAELIKQMVANGADKRNLKCRIAGGAKMLADASSFDIGKRNHTAIKKALWQAGILIQSEECGGDIPRTMSVEVGNGKVSLRRSGETVVMK